MPPIVLNKLATLTEHYGPTFRFGVDVVPLYRKAAYDPLSNTNRVRCCLPHAPDIRCWINERYLVQKEIVIPTECSCGSNNFYKVANIRECRSCGAIIVAHNTIPNTTEVPSVMDTTENGELQWDEEAEMPLPCPPMPDTQTYRFDIHSIDLSDSSWIPVGSTTGRVSRRTSVGPQPRRTPRA